MDPVLQMYLDVPVPVTSWNAVVSSFSNENESNYAQLSYTGSPLYMLISVHEKTLIASIGGKLHINN